MKSKKSLVKSMANALPEKAFMSQIIDLAERTGWLVYHTYDSRRSQKGFPDLVLVRPPEIIFAELKSQSGRLTDEQADWLNALSQIEKSPIIAVWRPDDIEVVAKYLSRPSKRQAG